MQKYHLAWDDKRHSFSEWQTGPVADVSGLLPGTTASHAARLVPHCIKRAPRLLRDTVIARLISTRKTRPFPSTIIMI